MNYIQGNETSHSFAFSEHFAAVEVQNISRVIVMSR